MESVHKDIIEQSYLNFIVGGQMEILTNHAWLVALYSKIWKNSAYFDIHICNLDLNSRSPDFNDKVSLV